MPYYRIARGSQWPESYVNQILCGDAQAQLRNFPDACAALIATSPPYWNIKDYGIPGQIGQSDYDPYLEELLTVWRECERILVPNGKLAIVTPIMPIPKAQMASQHTRHLKNIGADIEHSILANLASLHRFSLYIWQKQTSVKMFGSYPFPGNLYEDNTIEFIHVFVKEGKPLPISPAMKDPSRLTQEEWRNLTMQVWPLYPADVRRKDGHPCPYPPALAQRLIALYTFQTCPQEGFAGDLVIDPFCGIGATCLAAQAMQRPFIGIDLNPAYCASAQKRLTCQPIDPKAFMLNRVPVRGAHNSVQTTNPS